MPFPLLEVGKTEAERWDDVVDDDGDGDEEGREYSTRSEAESEVLGQPS